MDIGHGAIHTKIKGAHRYHTALCGGKAGLIEHELLLLVHRAARQHHIAAAQQAHAGSACLQRRFNILLPVAVGQKLNGTSSFVRLGRALMRAASSLSTAAHRCG